MTFNQYMFTLAKDAAGLTQSAIAQHVGISQAFLSKIESGLEQPNPEHIRGFADICGTPPEFFTADYRLSADTITDIFHKKRATLPAKPLKRANARVQIERFRILALFRAMDVPATYLFPSFPLDQHESPAQIAAYVRSAWRLPRGPIKNLTAAVEATGTPIIAADLEHEKLCGMSLPGAGSHSHIIAINSRLPASAQRFALAHEIGHLVMHSGVATSEMEKEADDFAAALLMPEQDIEPSLRNVRLRDLGPLKRHWRVSLAALIYRAHDLGVITPRHYRTLNVNLNQLPGGRKREPGEIEPERPELVSQVVEYLQSQHGYTVNDFCQLMAIDEQNFKQQYLNDYATQARLRVISN